MPSSDKIRSTKIRKSYTSGRWDKKHQEMGKTHNGDGMRYLFWRGQATLRVYVGQIGQRSALGGTTSLYIGWIRYYYRWDEVAPGWMRWFF